MLAPLLLAVLASIDAPGQSASMASLGQGGSGQNQMTLAPSSTTAVRLIQTSIARLQRTEAVSAKIRQQVELLGRRLVGSGSYRQASLDGSVLYRVELTMSVGDTIASLLQVCDGRFVWTYKALPQDTTGLKTTLTRVDLSAARRQMTTEEFTGTQLLLGGLPGILDQVAHRFDFPTPAAQGMLYGVPVWLVTGQRISLEPSTPDSKTDSSKVDHSAHHYSPQHVTIAFGKDDLFPYRIEFTLEDQQLSGEWSSTKNQSKIIFEWFEVQFGQTMDPQTFFFRPTDVPIEDATPRFIQNRGWHEGHPRLSEAPRN